MRAENDIEELNVAQGQFYFEQIKAKPIGAASHHGNQIPRGLNEDFVFFDLLKEQRQKFTRLTEVKIFYEI